MLTCDSFASIRPQITVSSQRTRSTKTSRGRGPLAPRRPSRSVLHPSSLHPPSWGNSNKRRKPNQGPYPCLAQHLPAQTTSASRTFNGGKRETEAPHDDGRECPDHERPSGEPDENDLVPGLVIGQYLLVRLADLDLCAVHETSAPRNADVGNEGTYSIDRPKQYPSECPPAPFPLPVPK